MFGFFLACTSTAILVEEEMNDRSTAVEQIPGDTQPEDTTEDTGGTETEFSGDDAFIFDDARVHEIEITLAELSMQALSNDPYGYVHGDFTLDGELVADVGVRLRGKVGSFRTLDGKPKFKIDFQEFVDDRRFYGLEALSLNNAVVDCSYLKESLGYRVFREAGLAAGRTGFARVTVNGEAYGFYVIVEVPDDRFLKAHFAEPDGNLYDGKYLYDWHTGNYSMVDFVPTQQDDFQLEEGEDVGLEDVKAVTRALVAAEQEGFSVVEPLVDMTQVHTVLAVEQWIGHVDGYAMNRNNYRVYFNPEDGKAELIPWDFDYAFIEDWEWGMNWRSPTGRMAARCWGDADCLEAQRQAVSTLVDTLDTEALLTQLDAWAELSGADTHEDPRRECSVASIDAEQGELRAWAEGRSAALRAWWSL